MASAPAITTVLAAALLFGAAASSAQADAGANLFAQQCAACHAVAVDAPRGLGPNLRGIVGKAAGAAAGFPYSADFKKELGEQTWTPALLDAWLTDPQDIAPGNYMMYKQADGEVRKAIIAYLQTVQ